MIYFYTIVIIKRWWYRPGGGTFNIGLVTSVSYTIHHVLIQLRVTNTKQTVHQKYVLYHTTIIHKSLSVVINTVTPRLSASMTISNGRLNIALAFVGDSDIARWPKHLLPELSSRQNLSHHNIHESSFHLAKNGAIMQNLPRQIEKASQEIRSRGTNTDMFDSIVFIACAGENDVSNNTPMDSIIKSFQDTFDAIISSSNWFCSKRPHLIFLGPKIEPWMTKNEVDARKGYFQLSERLNASIEKLCLSISEHHVGHVHDHAHDHGSKKGLHSHANKEECFEDGHSIFYLDSLTMFCGESKNLSVVGGCAIADSKYFDEDELHLSDKGYEKWKKEVEDIIAKLICGEECEESLDNSHFNRIVL